MAIGSSLKVTIGCRLPHGLTLCHPNPEIKTKVTLAGLHSSKLVDRTGAPAASYVTTEVDADFWEVWKTAYSSFTPLRTGAIFEARSEQEAKQKALDLQKVKTGFEPLASDAHGVKSDKEK